jgi:primosomal protein N' (replication factor Y)
MIVKGHDFPKVTVVGILLADMGLFSNDFRSGERTFDLLTQATGRAGRGDLPGYSVIQTYKPDHYVVATAANQDYAQFYSFEMAYRRLLGYPPVMQMMGILVTSKNEEAVQKAAERIAEEIKQIGAPEEVMVTGPAKAVIYKISEVFRRAIYVRAKNEAFLSGLPEQLKPILEQEFTENGVEAGFDLAPMYIL